ncbi:MAG: T9SS type A sorting domain-containing protein, partial [Bacteroidota bacterium]
TTVLASVNVSGTTERYYEWDLTGFINARRAAGATSVSLLVKNLTVTNYNQVNFYAKERTSNRPQLVAVTNTALTTAEPLTASKYDINENKPVISVYPNPAKSFFTVSYPPDVVGGILQLTDISGKTLLRQVVTEQSKQTMETLGLRSGTYILTIQKDDKKYSRQFIIEN